MCGEKDRGLGDVSLVCFHNVEAVCRIKSYLHGSSRAYVCLPQISDAVICEML